MSEEADPYCDLILSGRLPVDVVVDEPEVLAFVHPSPSFQPVHIVVIPKRHVRSLTELPDHDVAVGIAIITTLARVADQVEGEHGQARVFTNLGSLQHSRHLHWHVVAGSDRTPKGPPVTDQEVVWDTYWQQFEQ